jgi:hypothetical protein
MCACLIAAQLTHLQQIAAQGSGLGGDCDLAYAFDECRQDQFGLRRPPPIHGGLACSRAGSDRIDGQPVITFFLQQPQRHSEEFGLPR